MRVTVCLLVSFILGASACAGSARAPSADEQDDGFVVPGGKEDNYFSLDGREFLMKGTMQVTLEPELAEASDVERDARLKELVGYKHVALAWFMSQYLIKKDGDDANAAYGGFGGLHKASSYKDINLRQIEGATWAFDFTHLITGPNNLLSKLPLETKGGEQIMTFTMGNPDNATLERLEINAEWYRSAPWDGWNPDAVDAAQKVDIELAVSEEKGSTDGWLDYKSLMTDGELDIDIHFGWDYHDAYHVKHAESMFDWLIGEGFTAPVDSFKDLDRASGPFTKAITAGGEPVTISVRVFYPKSDSDTDPDTAEGGKQLEMDMRESLKTRDAIVYSGHSGPFYGFALANWKKTLEGDLDDSEMSSVEMPESRYQVILAEGCDTYQIGAAFMQNPAKPNGRFVDIITTTQASAASLPEAVQNFVLSLTETDSSGRHRAPTFKRLIRSLDLIAPWFKTLYGVHGIDDNPASHPWGRPELACTKCSTNSTCGGPGNLCVTVGSSGKRCAVACTDDRGCATGQACRAIASSSSNAIFSSACVPVNSKCE